MRIEISVDELNELLNLISPTKAKEIIDLIAVAEPQEEPEPQTQKGPTPFWTGDTMYVPTPFWMKTVSASSTTPKQSGTVDASTTYKVFNEQTK